METKKLPIFAALILTLFLCSCAANNNPNINNLVNPSSQETQTTVNIINNSIVKNPLPNNIENNSGFDTSKGFTDPNGCYDSEGGKFYEKRGFIIDNSGTRYEDNCTTGSVLDEVYCGPIGYKTDSFYTCPGECVNGECVGQAQVQPSTCKDSDQSVGSNDKYVKGTVTDPNGVITDSCLNSRTVKEWKCNSIGYRSSTNLDCPNGCTDGACIK